MAKLSDDIMEPFREIDQTILDNFTDHEIREIVASSHSLRRILESAKERHLQLLDELARQGSRALGS